MSTSTDPVRDHRARMELARLEARERRDQALVDQRSDTRSPAERVGIWERLHQVRLPVDSEHPILLLVAQQTHLTMAQVLEVQRERVG